MLELDRIEKLARALCRSARIDPDRPLTAEAALAARVTPFARAADRPAWFHFAEQARSLAGSQAPSLL